jgi:hypothetical protein
MFHTLGYSDCARPFGLNLIRSVRGIALARRLYRLILKHEHNYRDCPTMRLAGKVRMNLSDRRKIIRGSTRGMARIQRQCTQDRSTASAPARFRRAKRTASGTSVWTGRALQVGYDGLEIVGLAHLYSAL